MPGIGSFSIIDEHSVTEEDLGNKYNKSAFYWLYIDLEKVQHFHNVVFCAAVATVHLNF